MRSCEEILPLLVQVVADQNISTERYPLIVSAVDTHFSMELVFLSHFYVTKFFKSCQYEHTENVEVIH